MPMAHTSKSKKSKGKRMPAQPSLAPLARQPDQTENSSECSNKDQNFGFNIQVPVTDGEDSIKLVEKLFEFDDNSADISNLSQQFAAASSEPQPCRNSTPDLVKISNTHGAGGEGPSAEAESSQQLSDKRMMAAIIRQVKLLKTELYDCRQQTQSQGIQTSEVNMVNCSLYPALFSGARLMVAHPPSIIEDCRMDQASQERMNVDASLSNLSMLSDQKLQAAMTHTEKEILKLWESMNLQEQKFTAKIQEIIAVESRQSADTKCSALITERDLLKEQSIYYKREVERLVTQLTEKSKTVEELSVGNNKLEAELQAIKDNILALRREVKEDQAASTQLSWRLQRTEEYLQRQGTEVSSEQIGERRADQNGNWFVTYTNTELKTDPQVVGATATNSSWQNENGNHNRQKNYERGNRTRSRGRLAQPPF